jgi:hypothetical protein
MSREDRKNLGKRKGFWNRVRDLVSGPKPPSSEQGYIAGGPNPTQWPGRFDNTPLDGDRYVNGTCCRTVGEYKAASTKNVTDLGGLDL